MPEPLVIERGTCHVMFAYDVGFGIDLDAAEQAIVAVKQREKIRHRRKSPAYFEYEPPPIRVMQQCEPVLVADFTSADVVDAMIYDFGAISVTYRFPLRGPLERLLPLSEALYDNAELLEGSRALVDELLGTIQPAVKRPQVADFVEDYVFYQLAGCAPARSPVEIVEVFGSDLARILRSERATLSEQEIADALGCRISYSPDDVTIIDWNAAVAFDEDADDTRIVLEHANVELLEMRYLDSELDAALDRSHKALIRRPWWVPMLYDSSRAELREIAQLQMDNALLFEGVNNALKLLGDQYLARVYRLAAQRLHVDEWDASILRKLQTLEGTYEKVSALAAAHRAEVLEWIIIILIAGEIVLMWLE